MLLLLMSPAAVIPFALDRFVFGKLTVAAVGAAFAFSAPAMGRLPASVRVLVSAALALLVVSAGLSTGPFTAVFGRAPSNEGVFVLAVYLLAGISGARILGPRARPRTMEVAFSAMALCSLAIAALAVLETAGLRPLSTTASRPGSLLGSASDQGALAVLYAGPLLAKSLSSRRYIYVAGSAAAVVTTVLSGSRGSLVGLVLAVLLLTVTNRSAFGWRLPTVVLSAVGTLVLLVPETRSRVLGSSPLASHTVNGRGLLWRETITMLIKHPLLGVGPSQFENAIVSEHTLAWQRDVGPTNPPGSPHNWILQALSAGGPSLLIVVVTLGCLVSVHVARAVRRDERGWVFSSAVGLAGYSAALLFHFTSPGTTGPAAVIAGSLLATDPIQVKASVWISRCSCAVATLLAGCFLCSSVAEIYLRQGLNAAAAGRLGSANSDFGTAALLRPWDADLPFVPFHAYVLNLTEGNRAAASYAESWNRSLQHIAGDEQVLENRAALLLAEQKYSNAAELLAGGVKRDPYNPMLLMLNAVTHAHLGEYGIAKDDLTLAAKIDPTNPQPWLDLAIVYKSIGEFELSNQATATAAQIENHSH